MILEKGLGNRVGNDEELEETFKYPVDQRKKSKYKIPDRKNEGDLSKQEYWISTLEEISSLHTKMKKQIRNEAQIATSVNCYCDGVISICLGLTVFSMVDGANNLEFYGQQWICGFCQCINENQS